MVAAAPSPAWAAARSAIASAVMSGTSPLMTTTSSSVAIWSAAARTAWPVPRASFWTGRMAASGRGGRVAGWGAPGPGGLFLDGEDGGVGQVGLDRAVGPADDHDLARAGRERSVDRPAH